MGDQPPPPNPSIRNSENIKAMWVIVQWNLINKATIGPHKFDRINGVAVLMGGGGGESNFMAGDSA